MLVRNKIYLENEKQKKNIKTSLLSECFFRSIDSSRFYPGVVRESLTVKSIGECKSHISFRKVNE